MTPRVVVIAGPTAAGKTAAALTLAERSGAVIVSADAMQIYRGMDVGTGKVSANDRARVPHFGIDLREPHEAFDAADFVALVDEVLAAHPRVILCGGTSLYLRSAWRGLVATPKADLALRAELEALPDLYERLQVVDPALAARLHPNDKLRVVRGMEVFLTTGTPLSALHAAHEAAPDRLAVFGAWLDHPDLDARIDARVLSMMADGYLEEVRGLLDAGVDRRAKPMMSLGYHHLTEAILDGLPLDEAVRRTQRDTRTFARKQRNWMRTLALPQMTDGIDESLAVLAERAWAG